MKRIVVGVDGSPNAAAALRWAIELARRTEAEVVAVHALGLLEPGEGDESMPAAPHRAEVVDRFEHVWCAPLDVANVRERRVVLDGSPTMVLLREAADAQADVIVIGRRGAGLATALRLGSTSSQVAQEADVPVVVVPDPSGRREPG